MQCQVGLFMPHLTFSQSMHQFHAANCAQLQASTAPAQAASFSEMYWPLLTTTLAHKACLGVPGEGTPPWQSLTDQQGTRAQALWINTPSLHVLSRQFGGTLYSPSEGPWWLKLHLSFVVISSLIRLIFLLLFLSSFISHYCLLGSPPKINHLHTVFVSKAAVWKKPN